VADHVSVGAWIEGPPMADCHDCTDEAQQGEMDTSGLWGWVELRPGHLQVGVK
jgi:hypothetical protein